MYWRQQFRHTVNKDSKQTLEVKMNSYSAMCHVPQHWGVKGKITIGKLNTAGFIDFTNVVIFLSKASVKFIHHFLKLNPS